MRNVILVIIFFSSLIFSCRNSGNKNKITVARVNEKYLYLSDLHGIVPANTPTKDSLSIIKDYIEKWIKRQVIIDKAELNLTNEQKDVDELIENYRAALLIYKYQQEYLNQRLDTNLTDEEIEKYYNEHKPEFKLENNIVKAVFIKIAKSAPKISSLKKWYISNNEKDIELLNDYCSQFANKFDEFHNEWINFSDLLVNVPIKIESQDNTLKTAKSIEATDSLYYYFINIRSYKLKQDASPFDYVKNSIKKIILNKRKLDLLKNLEQDLFQDAVSNKEVEIYQ
jgi:hypothetical protein